MADSDTGSSDARLTLEREKWQTEKVFRERELTLKERELTLKEHEWNPLTVPVSVATLALVGNIFATWWNGRQQRVLEKEKAIQQHELEKIKAEGDRVLEVIKTGDPEKAVVNLKFLLEAGLIASADMVGKLRAYLAKTPVSSGPVLPVAGTRFNIEPSDKLSIAAAAALEINLKAFINYLDGVGFPSDIDDVKVRVEQLLAPNALYLGGEKAIVIDWRIANDPYLLNRAYMDHLLTGGDPGFQRRSAISAIEAGLADYFTGSFARNPALGTAETARQISGVPKPFVRLLDNDKPYVPYRDGAEPQSYGEIWGGAFWELRTKLGADLADRIIMCTWKTLDRPVEERLTDASFISALLKATEAQASLQQVQEVRMVLERRKFPVPG